MRANTVLPRPPDKRTFKTCLGPKSPIPHDTKPPPPPFPDNEDVPTLVAARGKPYSVPFISLFRNICSKVVHTGTGLGAHTWCKRYQRATPKRKIPWYVACTAEFHASVHKRNSERAAAAEPAEDGDKTR